MADYCTHTFRKIVSNYNWKNDSTIRTYRLRCKCCGYMWTVHYDKKLNREVIPEAMSDSRILNPKRFTPEEVKLILTDPRPGAELARIFNVAPQSVNQVRTGRAYKDLWPDIPRVVPGVRNYKSGPVSRSTKVTCQDCEHWWQKQCGLGVPEAGGTFAVECSFFQKDE